jgi:hypothetical protein
VRLCRAVFPTGGKRTTGGGGYVVGLDGVH